MRVSHYFLDGQTSITLLLCLHIYTYLLYLTYSWRQNIYSSASMNLSPLPPSSLTAKHLFVCFYACISTLIYSTTSILDGQTSITLLLCLRIFIYLLYHLLPWWLIFNSICLSGLQFMFTLTADLLFISLNAIKNAFILNPRLSPIPFTSVWRGTCIKYDILMLLVNRTSCHINHC